MRARTVRTIENVLQRAGSLLCAGACLVVLLSQTVSPGRASTWDTLPMICERAALRASQQSAVPLSVLRAIALTETGRTKNGSFRPWPWTVNMEGKGVWFDTLEEARAYVARHHARGARSYDVGCFQINYRWHGQHFASPEAMFDPDANAAYAARFLGELYAEFGDWSRAAGAYHSRTPQYANRYRARFDRIRARLTRDTEDEVVLAASRASEVTMPEPPRPPEVQAVPAPPGPATAPAIRDNRFPLLVPTGAPRGLGSLVPLEIVARPRLIDQSGG